MSEKRVIEDPGQWRVGDDVSVTFEDGATLTGKLRERFNGGEMWVGDRAVRYLNGESIQAHTSATVTVTRTVEPIPEPTVPWALVRFADDSTALRDEGSDDFPWLMSESATWTTWDDVVSTHGAPVAVSLPRWSDEADGLRARVEAFIAELDRDGFEILNASHEAHRLRALLAEGGEA